MSQDYIFQIFSKDTLQIADGVVIGTWKQREVLVILFSTGYNPIMLFPDSKNEAACVSLLTDLGWKKVQADAVKPYLVFWLNWLNGPWFIRTGIFGWRHAVKTESFWTPDGVVPESTKWGIRGAAYSPYIFDENAQPDGWFWQVMNPNAFRSCLFPALPMMIVVLVLIYLVYLYYK